VICDNYVDLKKNRSATDVIMTVVFVFRLLYAMTKSGEYRLSGYKQVAAIDLVSVK